jgi:hypothetical protein
MTSKHTWNLPPACCSAKSASLGGSMATAPSSYGGLSCLSSAPKPEALRLYATGIVVLNPIQRYRATAHLSSLLPIAEMSSTVRCTVMANRLARACSWRSV